MNKLLVLLSVLAVMSYVCRLRSFRWGVHKTRYILLHVLLGACSSWSLMMTMERQASLLSVTLLSLALAWIAATYHAWSDGPPRAMNQTPSQHKHRV